MKKFIALFLIVSLLSVNCATLTRGTSQKIPATSNPPGAKIVVDGEEMGYAPLNLKLKRKKSHIIRIEKQGYNPLEIGITRKTSSALSILGNLFWGAVGFVAGFFGALIVTEAFEEHRPVAAWSCIIGGPILGWGVPTLIDFSSGANYELSPKELNVTLTKYGEKPQSNIILIDAEKLQNIKWIRIKFYDSGKEDIINLD